tara:strand:+ start:356 stop:1324 length:969 start_codon:yes stop_codon:yes gene_type:complete
MRTCDVVTPNGPCTNKHKGRGMCDKHLQRFRKYGDPLYVHPIFSPKFCEVKDCDKPLVAKGLCDTHYSRMKRNGTTELVSNTGGTCEVVEAGVICGEPRNSITTEGLKLCVNHAHKWRKWGDPNHDYYRDTEFGLGSPCQVPLTYKDGDPICGRTDRNGSIGVCGAHHSRKLKTGDYMTDQPLALVGLTTEERYEIYTDRSEKYIKDEQMEWMDDPCWKWHQIGKHGYGQISSQFNGEGLTHRAFYTFHNGPVEGGRVIHHLCGERDCCNPDHLIEMNEWENIDEASRFKYVNNRNKKIEDWINTPGMTMKELRKLITGLDT